MDKNDLQIVVVDDEAQITDLLMTYLLCLSKTFAVTTFNDPEEARAYLLQNHIDVLITDFKMPKYDGIQLMKLAPKDATKILISGYVSEITEGHLNELKASFFEKPVPMKELGKLINEANAKKRKAA
jgi:DNA-binding NtrC family response regulator